MGKSVSEILDEVIEHFAEHPRCVSEVSTLKAKQPVGAFVGKGGKRDAVGLYLNDEMIALCKKSLAINKASIRVLDNKILDNKVGNFKTLDDIFTEEAKGVDKYFWAELQVLHDFNPYWSEVIEGKQTLSESGREEVERLREEYS